MIFDDIRLFNEIGPVSWILFEDRQEVEERFDGRSRRSEIAVSDLL